MGQFEWDLSNLNIAYPFEQPGVLGGNDIVADAIVQDVTQGGRVRLDELTITNWDSESISSVFSYVDGEPFFDNYFLDYSLSQYGSWWTLVVTDNSGRVATLLLNGEAELPINIFGAISFVASVQECDPKAIRSIEVTDSLTDVTHVLTGDIEISEGYNVGIQTTGSVYTQRAGAVSVSLSAVPGTGLGVAPSDCAPDAVLRSINTVAPDNDGNFVLATKDCYRALVPTTGSPVPTVFDPTPAMLQLFNDCGQCCSCQDYENCYKALVRQHGKGRNTGERLARTIDDLSDLIDKVRDEKDLRKIPTMDLMLRPTPGYILGVQINLMNNGTEYELDMDQDDINTVLVKMLVTSEDVEMGGVFIIPGTCYLFNSRYGNPWIRVEDTDITLEPVDFTDANGVGIIIAPDLVPEKFYESIGTTQYVSLFFELFWPTTAAPADQDEVNVRLISDIFKPYTLLKTELLQKPFEGA